MNAREQQDLERLMRELRSEFRTFRLIPKERSFLMWATYYATLMFLWNPRFMTDYTTVFLTWVYMPSRLIGTAQSYSTLRHERVHMRDCFRYGIVPYMISYTALLPAVLTMRSVWEMRAYTETMRVEYERTGTVRDATVDHIVKQLVSPMYLWMFPFPRAARRWVERARARVLASVALPPDRDGLKP